MTVLEAIRKSAEFLTRKEVEQPRLQVEWMLAHLLELPRLSLYMEFEKVLQPDQVERLREWVMRRGQREPLQHLLGSASFCGHDIQVSPDVLVPRPETEVLAEEAALDLEARKTPGTPNPRILDFGTGSGCLAIALALRFPEAKVHAIDKSDPALVLARRNAGRHGVAERIEFYSGTNPSVLPAGCRYDLVVANPPYIPTHEIESLSPEVRDHDPKMALDGGADGLDVFRQLASELPDRLEAGSRFFAEFGDGQASELTGLFEKQGWKVLDVKPDLSGRPRILVACRTD